MLRVWTSSKSECFQFGIRNSECGMKTSSVRFLTIDDGQWTTDNYLGISTTIE